MPIIYLRERLYCFKARADDAMPGLYRARCAHDADKYRQIRQTSATLRH